MKCKVCDSHMEPITSHNNGYTYYRFHCVNCGHNKYSEICIALVDKNAFSNYRLSRGIPWEQYIKDYLKEKDL